MVYTHQENINHQAHKKQLNPLTAGITGFILGATGTAALILSDKDTRKKFTQKATTIKSSLLSWSQRTLHELQDTGMMIKEDMTHGKEQEGEQRNHDEEPVKK